MSCRSPFLRFFVLLLATLQVASPGVSAIADGLIALENSARPSTHVEATTTSGCPVVHAPDCGVCRFLSQAAAPARQAALGLQLAACTVEPTTASREPRAAAIALPDGRAPPTP